ncbi:hypothetical protein ACRRTK_002809 [Alexandromys fortis]
MYMSKQTQESGKSTGYRNVYNIAVTGATALSMPRSSKQFEVSRGRLRNETQISR